MLAAETVLVTSIRHDATVLINIVKGWLYIYVLPSISNVSTSTIFPHMNKEDIGAKSTFTA